MYESNLVDKLIKMFDPKDLEDFEFRINYNKKRRSKNTHLTPKKKKRKK